MQASYGSTGLHTPLSPLQEMLHREGTRGRKHIKLGSAMPSGVTRGRCCAGTRHRACGWGKVTGGKEVRRLPVPGRPSCPPAHQFSSLQGWQVPSGITPCTGSGAVVPCKRNSPSAVQFSSSRRSGGSQKRERQPAEAATRGGRHPGMACRLPLSSPCRLHTSCIFQSGSRTACSSAGGCATGRTRGRGGAVGEAQAWAVAAAACEAGRQWQ